MLYGSRLQRPLLMLDSSSLITEAAVIYQLAEFAVRADLLSPLWLSFRLTCDNGLVLKPATIPLNVWHPLCGETFYAAHPAHLQLPITQETTAVKGALDSGMHYVLSKGAGSGLRWTAVCPSLSMHFNYTHCGMASPTHWVPAYLSHFVPIHLSIQITLPRFQTLVNYDQLADTRTLHTTIDRIHSMGWGAL